MTQEDINKTVVDVVYDNEQIIHVLEPNLDGIRGISINHFMVRDTIAMVRIYLSEFDQTKIDEYENELIYNYNQSQL